MAQRVTKYKNPCRSLSYQDSKRLHWVLQRGSSSQTASHYDKILGKALHFGHLKTSQFTIEVQHSLISLMNLTERTQRA